MKPGFVEAIERFQTKLRRQALAAAVGRAGLLLLSWIGLLGLGDYLFHFDDRGLRALLLATIAGMAIAVYLRCIRPAIQLPINGLTLARWLELQDPTLQGKLAAAWEFAHVPPGDMRWGSPTLRAMVVEEVERISPGLSDLYQRVRGPDAIPLYLTGILVLLLGIGTIINPVIFGTALIRLFNPFSDLPWPQRTHLKIIFYPEVISRGGSFLVEVGEETGSLPDQVWIAFRDPSGAGVATTRFRMSLQGGKFVFQRDHIQSDFEFRVWGGDDHSQPWRPVRVVEPPRVVDLKVHLVPPLYTGWPGEVSTGPIRAIAGTTAIIEGRANRELLGVWLEREPEGTLQGQLLGDRRSFRFGTKAGTTKEQVTGWVLKRSGRYKIRLKATDGTTSVGEPEWEVRVLNDLPPVVTAELQVPLPVATRRGKIPFHVSVKDDLGLRRIGMSIEQETALKGSLNVYEDSSSSGPRGRMSDPHSWGQVIDRDQTADLSRWKDLAYGPAQLVVTAEDFLGQSSTSAPLEIRILTDDEFKEKLLSESERVTDQLTDIHVLQSQINREWSSLWQKIRDSQQVDQGTVDRFYALDLLQTQVIQNIGSRSDGALATISGLLKLVENNPVDFAEERTLREAYGRLAKGFQELAVPLQTGRSHLVRWSQHLLESSASPQETARQINAMQPQAEEIIRQQGAWEEFLAALIDFLGGIKSRNAFRRHLEMLLQKERTLLSETQRLGSKTIGRDRQELAGELITALNVLSQEQTDVARELESLLGRVAGGSNFQEIRKEDEGGLQDPTQGSAPGLRDGSATPMDKAASPEEGTPQSLGEGIDDPLVQQAVRVAFRSAVVGKMRDAGAALKENRISEAVSLQKQCIAVLEEMLRILSGPDQTEHIQQRWQAIEQEIKALQNSQRRLIEDFRERWQDPKGSGAEADFAARQSEILSQTEALLQKLPANAGQKVRERLEGATSHMDAAREAASRGNRKQALEHAINALHDLSVAFEEAMAEELGEIANQSSSVLIRHIKELLDVIENQGKVLQETQALDERRAQLKVASEIDTWQKEVSVLAQSQRTLRERIAVLEGSVVDMGVWQSLLADTGRQMEEAARRLTTNDTGKITQAIQSQALETLQSLAQALEHASQEQAGEEKPAGEAPSSVAEPGPQEGMPWKIAVQLQTLRALQASINSRTEALARRLAQNGQAPGELPYLMGLLEREQLRVVELVQRLKAEMSEKSTEEPSSKEGEPARPSPPAEKAPAPVGPVVKPGRPGSLDDLLPR